MAYSSQDGKSVTIGTVCFLFNSEEDKVLLLERSGHPMKDKVTGVGGKTHFEEDIYTSCLREIKEETGLTARNLKLNGVIKTVSETLDSSWILFVYSTDDFSGEQQDCPEGRLFWYSLKELPCRNMIGFINEILPHVLRGGLIEGTIVHDGEGKVLEKNIRVIK
jgi:ADP-ribose pyrophosphatase YjhB (NUDIX family)